MPDASESTNDRTESGYNPILQPVLACMRCRKRKAGCDRQLPGCSRCMSIGQPCEYESLPKRKRKSPTGPKQLRTIEDRVASIEACLKSSGILLQGDLLSAELGTGVTVSDVDYRQNENVLSNRNSVEPTSSHASRAPAQERAIAQAPKQYLPPVQIEQGRCVLSSEDSLQQETSTIEKCEPRQYWPRIAERLGGPLADLLFPRGVYCITRLGEPVMDFRSPQGLRWLSEKSTPNSAREIVQTMISCTESDSEPTSCLSNIGMSPPVPLPPEGETLNILNAYFKYCQPTYPVFDEVSFRSLVQEQFHGRPPRGTAWYAAFNVALCLGMRALDAMGLRGIDMAKDRRPSDYFENAMRHSSELLMDTPNILGAGALIGLAIYIQTTENVDPSFSLLGVALRQVRQLYLTNKNLATTSAQLRDCRQIRRLFWLAYSINNDTILQSGCPWVPADSELDFEFTQEDLIDEPIMDGERPNPAKYEVFFARVKLALIQSMVYRQLYTTSARQKPLVEIAKLISRFDHELREWESTILESVRPPGNIMLQPALLGLRYHSTIMMVHHLSTMVAYNSLNQGNETAADANTQSSVKACVRAARSTVGVLRSLPNRTCKYALNQLVMKSALGSFGTIFSNILANPEDLETSNDIDLMNFVVEIVHSFKQHGSYVKVVKQLLCVCEVMTRVAREVVRARRRKRPMLDYPRTSLLASNEASDGPPSAQFDWNSIISEPPTTSLEQFLFIAPSIENKNNPDACCGDTNLEQYHAATVQQVSESLPLDFGEGYTTEQALSPNLWPFNLGPQAPGLESHGNNRDSIALQLNQDFQ